MSLHRCAGRGRYGLINSGGAITNVLEAQPPYLVVAHTSGRTSHELITNNVCKMQS